MVEIFPGVVIRSQTPIASQPEKKSLVTFTDAGTIWSGVTIEEEIRREILANNQEFIAKAKSFFPRAYEKVRKELEQNPGRPTEKDGPKEGPSLPIVPTPSGGEQVPNPEARKPEAPVQKQEELSLQPTIPPKTPALETKPTEPHSSTQTIPQEVLSLWDEAPSR